MTGHAAARLLVQQHSNNKLPFSSYLAARIARTHTRNLDREGFPASTESTNGCCCEKASTQHSARNLLLCSNCAGAAALSV
eukprot:1157290-Pelagomonas_calceolata.AAC.3